MVAQDKSLTFSNQSRNRILKGDVCSVRTPNMVTCDEMAMLCKMAKIDGMFLDMEHSTRDLHIVAQLILACNYVGVSPIVHTPSKWTEHISRILDAGVAAVVVPHVDTVDELKSLVRAAKYALLGDRGCNNNQPIVDFQKVPIFKHNDLLNRETMLIPTIEIPVAVELVDEFLAINVVDGNLIGSNDLCTALRISEQYDNPLHQNVVTRIITACKKARKLIGIGVIGPKLDFLEKPFYNGTVMVIKWRGVSHAPSWYAKVGQHLRGAQRKGPRSEVQPTIILLINSHVVILEIIFVGSTYIPSDLRATVAKTFLNDIDIA